MEDDQYHENGGGSPLPSDCNGFLEPASVEDDTRRGHAMCRRSLNRWMQMMTTVWPRRSPNRWCKFHSRPLSSCIASHLELIMLDSYMISANFFSTERNASWLSPINCMSRGGIFFQLKHTGEMLPFLGGVGSSRQCSEVCQWYSYVYTCEPWSMIILLLILCSSYRWLQLLQVSLQ